MQNQINDVVIEVATANGSGSQSSNNILIRSLFRMGIPVGGKNLFPSNIAGLPTWFTIRAHHKGYTARREFADVYVALNPDTLHSDVKKVHPNGFFIYNSDLGISLDDAPPTLTLIPVSFKTLVTTVTDSVKLRKLLLNMIYVGLLAELLDISQECLESSVRTQFKGKEHLLEVNFQAIQVGQKYAQEHLEASKFKHKLEPMDGNREQILIDGNTAAALGLVMGGCTFMSWYPITPSSSLAEGFGEFANEFRKDALGKATYALVQAEDELSAISMVLGAGWAGARAATATSGPGLSLMNEAAGLFYFAEVPGVLWNVQRMGPSTGLPTRNSQGDLLSAVFMSHGDTHHVVLLPGNVKECFEFGQVAFDLAERLQTLVLVLSDLDLGMNFWRSEPFQYPERPFDRGKVLTKADLDERGHFHRYKDIDGDGIPYRTLPGTPDDRAAYFTRGSGHNEKGQYSEDPINHENLLNRLRLKLETAKKLVPKPDLDTSAGIKTGLIAFGSSDSAIPEARDTLRDLGIATNYMRIKAYPFSSEVEGYLKMHERIFIIEQNRDAQLRSLLTLDFTSEAKKFSSVLHYNGLPLDAASIATGVKKGLES